MADGLFIGHFISTPIPGSARGSRAGEGVLAFTNLHLWRTDRRLKPWHFTNLICRHHRVQSWRSRPDWLNNELFPSM
jgi:hypothetical protein